MRSALGPVGRWLLQRRAVAWVTLRADEGWATEGVLLEMLEANRVATVVWFAHRVRIPRRRP